MIKVITPVGTSVFENFLKDNEDTNFKRAYEYFKDNKLKAEELDREVNRRENIEKAINEKWFKSNPNASAEIKSLIKIKEELKDNLEIYLLYSDTALSRLSVEILKEAISYYDELKGAKVEIRKIERLQIWDREEFKRGMTNLIKTIYNIAQGYWENIVINITGGYKATIPYLTILGQVNKCLIYYIFEDTDTLIKIPYLPIDIKWDLFDKYWEFFKKIEHPNSLPKNDLPDYFLKDCESLLELEDISNTCYVSLNLLGEIFWRKYKSKFFIFYAPENVYEEIKKQQNIQEIISSKFFKPEIRKNKTEKKNNNHLVYDDGNNPFRIFYFEEGEKIFIYKTFESHKEYEDYLKKTEFDERFKKQIKKNSKLYKQEVQNV